MTQLPIITPPPIDIASLRARLASAGPGGFWRSLNELAETPEFEELLQREFPSKLPTLADGLSRRKFLTLMAASLALAGVTGCNRDRPEEIVPYVKLPDDITPGEPLYYATAVTRGGYALGVLAESHVGRPTKLEGNPLHPASLGATDAFTQAEILRLYDPDRSQTVMYRGTIDTWERFLSSFSQEMDAIQQKKGAGLRILTETITSPSLAAQLEAVLKELPEARWHQSEPAGLDNVREGTKQARGADAEPVYSFDQADVVVSLDCDFLSVLPGSVPYARQFIDRRRSPDKQQNLNRLYAVESTPTITGAMADHRVALRPSLVHVFSRQLAAQLGVPEIDDGPQAKGVDDELLRALVSDLQDSRGKSLVLAGPGQPPAVHALAHAINAALGNVGTTVKYRPPVVARPIDQRGSLAELTTAMTQGEVDTLVMLGANPVYNAPGHLEFVDALSKVRLRVHLSEYYDETSFLCDWHIPQAHCLESWGDARAFDGRATIQQPLIAPLYGGKTPQELVAVLQNLAGHTSLEVVQEFWKERLGEDGFDRTWRRALHDGLVEEPPTEEPADDDADPSRVEEAVAIALAEGQFEIEFRPDPSVWDGRYANNAWLQELPKPLTKLTWDNVAAVSPATAEKLGLANGDVVEITVEKRSLRAPVWVTPGQPAQCISLTMGYGRTRAGSIGTGIGYNVQAIRPDTDAWFAAGTVRKTGDTHRLATTQDHHDMMGRDIVRVATAERLKHHEEPHAAGHHELLSLYPEEDTSQGNQWAMVINQTACIGCNACVIACQAENNIPVVGKDQVLVGREMHWLRIDRYYHGDLDDPETYFQPMACVHCEKAPCEVVCPVAATVHDHEGTSNMIYNRCVGTRYCSNNCPYKVRRFNFLQYTDEETESLKLMRNPDVTVRSRGVMEKCSYCIQRLDLARIAAKKEGRLVEEGEVMTACQQACPTSAIAFGNLNSKESAVRELKKSPLNYGVLAELNTQPRTTYLTRVVNPHPDLPAPGAAQKHEDADKAES